MDHDPDWTTSTYDSLMTFRNTNSREEHLIHLAEICRKYIVNDELFGAIYPIGFPLTQWRIGVYNISDSKQSYWPPSSKSEYYDSKNQYTFGEFPMICHRGYTPNTECCDNKYSDNCHDVTSWSIH